jgi:spore maturation protein CgeB
MTSFSMPRTAGAVHPATPTAAGSGEEGRRALVVCDQWLGSDGYAGMKALRRTGWDVQVIPEWEYVPVRWRSRRMKLFGRLMRTAAERELRDELVLHAKRLAPEFLLVFKGRFITPGTITTLRAMGVRCYNFYPDVSFRAHGPHLPRVLPEYDWIFTTKSFGLSDMREQLGVTRASVLMFAFDPDLHRPMSLSVRDLETYAADVSYVGTWSPKKERLLSEIVRRRPTLRVRIWGEQWHRATVTDEAFRHAVEGREVLGAGFVKAICASKINLSIMSEKRVGSSKGDQVATRTFSVPACGAFVIHERTEEVLQLFREDEEIVCYDDVEELLDKIDLYLADETRRLEIAAGGLAVVRARHSWDTRIGDILTHHEQTVGSALGAAR